MRSQPERCGGLTFSLSLSFSHSLLFYISLTPRCDTCVRGLSLHSELFNRTIFPQQTTQPRTKHARARKVVLPARVSDVRTRPYTCHYHFGRIPLAKSVGGRGVLANQLSSFAYGLYYWHRELAILIAQLSIHISPLSGRNKKMNYQSNMKGQLTKLLEIRNDLNSVYKITMHQ